MYCSIAANTPSVFPGLRPRIWSHLLRLVTKAMSDRLRAKTTSSETVIESDRRAGFCCHHSSSSSPGSSPRILNICSGRPVTSFFKIASVWGRFGLANRTVGSCLKAGMSRWRRERGQRCNAWNCDCPLNVSLVLQGRRKLFCITQITVTGERQVGFSPLMRAFEIPSFLDVNWLESQAVESPID